ncbi:MAG: AI-2E family transporter [Candidatus Sericytochromatia bacterium]|nr:AI-2E family transporter [Candidatus Sericytochromatia bacterium]
MIQTIEKGTVAMAAPQDSYTRRLFWLLALALGSWAFFSLSGILLPIIMGAFGAFALWPIVARLPQKWPRWVRVVIAMLAASCVITVFFLILVPSLLAQGEQIATKFPEYLQQLTSLGATGETFLKRYGINYDLSAHELEIRQRLQETGIAIVAWVGASIAGLVGNLLQMIIAFWVIVYGLLEGPEIIQWVNDQLPAATRAGFKQGMTITGTVLRSFLKGMVVLGLIIGTAVGIGAWLIGMPYALSIALVAGMLEAVPNIGPIIAGCFAGVLAFAQSPVLALKMIALFTVVQVLENNLIVPKVLGDSLEVHPMAIFIAVLIGAQFFGLVGLFLAGPLVAVGWRIWVVRHKTYTADDPPPPITVGTNPEKL